MSPQAAQVGSGFFYVIAWGMTHSVSGGPMDKDGPGGPGHGIAPCQASFIRPASRPNGAWSFNMTPARLRGGYGSRDCEGTRAYH